MANYVCGKMERCPYETFSLPNSSRRFSFFISFYGYLAISNSSLQSTMAELEVTHVGGLGDPNHLEKIEKLQQLNISYDTQPPQIVVIGSQSAGKSSVLERLTGFPFPRAPSYHARYTTELITRKHTEETVVASIQPNPDSSRERAAKLQEFEVNIRLKAWNSEIIQEIYQLASTEMKICLRAEVIEDSAQGRGEDILQIQVAGPKEEYLKIVDPPELPNELIPVFANEDIFTKQSKFKNYIRKSQSIVLVVASCTADLIKNNYIKTMESVDPRGESSIVVLTKPDLIAEYTSKKKMVGLINFNQGTSRLGYFVVWNPGEIDATSDLAERNYAERTFFNRTPWNQLNKSLVRFDSLSLRLRELLRKRTEKYFVELKEELTTRLADSQKHLKCLDEPRVTTDQQRTYLSRIAVRFSDIIKNAMGTQLNERLFLPMNHQSPLIANVQEMSKVFTSTLFSRGHCYRFEGEEEEEEEEDYTYGQISCHLSRNDVYDFSFTLLEDYSYPELEGLLTKPFYCSGPSAEYIMDCIKELYSGSHGGEFCAFSNSVLPTLFKQQVEKWMKLTLAHVSNVIMVIHDFLRETVFEACPNYQVRRALWKSLEQDVLDCYRRAIKHAEFLLHVECEGHLVTTNPDFEHLLAKYRAERLKGTTDSLKKTSKLGKGTRNTVFARAPDFMGQVYGDTHDALKAYYEIARARLADGVSQQVVNHFLLRGEQSVFQVFTPERVLSMTSEEVQSIAGESPDDVRSREEIMGALQQEIDNLEKALDVLRN
ncbi:P-loop containing nucleoside triphosphate hydrolase protein [Daldinia bambusicola]|nr:P-loop containing nucleoside triphosphate hydrolase protein [Daldinia bambusicola]